MATKIKLTRPELKRYRDALVRFERYLPMLQLKQQQLQIAVRQVSRDLQAASKALKEAREQLEPSLALLGDVAGVDVRKLAKPEEVKTSTNNIAGVNVPVFEDAVFPVARYSLFATSAWVDRVLIDLRRVNRQEVELELIELQHRLLKRELTKIVQRVNLFEKVKIPEAREVIRLIRIKLGDEMTAAVGRAKIAKAKLAESGQGKRLDFEPDDREENAA
jgi:V/A-type H+-transporting ATPase subunit D